MTVEFPRNNCNISPPVAGNLGLLGPAGDPDPHVGQADEDWDDGCLRDPRDTPLDPSPDCNQIGLAGLNDSDADEGTGAVAVLSGQLFSSPTYFDNLTAGSEPKRSRPAPTFRGTA